ncbi:MAG: hypothetical protein CMO80_12905 [Verrucomicrobiales bacterium]|nr:hypothetical protein [Verrucomicrobiales bacterium]|tara:strand:+ start:482 stop:802 length:321 start_codon:yes stop_codon:yes gene_type:complete
MKPFFTLLASIFLAIAPVNEAFSGENSACEGCGCAAMACCESGDSQVPIQAPTFPNGSHSHESIAPDTIVIRISSRNDHMQPIHRVVYRAAPAGVSTRILHCSFLI